MSLALGKISVFAVRLLIPWSGAWIADCDIDLASDVPLPTGKQTLTVGSASIVGTVDARGTGRFGEKARCRIVAGAGAWGASVTAEHFHNDAPAGVMSTQVLNATASQIGETVVDPNPVSYGIDYERVATQEGLSATRAAQVFEGRQWYVDGKGITQVSDWPKVALGKDVDVLLYDPETQIATTASDEIIWPGTEITDSRFGTITVREVDQSFTTAGSRGSLYHSTTPASRLGSALRQLASGFGGDQFLKIYRYRIVKQGTDGRLQLQVVSKASGVPDTLPLSVWPGVPGMSAKYKLGSLVLVGFAEGNKTLPKVIGFERIGDASSDPGELHLNAKTLIALGANAGNFVALANLVNSAIKDLQDQLKAWVPVANDGGAALHTLLTTPGVGTGWAVASYDVAAEKVKAE